jgi:hypothetical protein
MSSRFGSRTDGGIIRNFIESYDGDAANYFRANTAITSAADKNAINTFYLGLKSDGIYTKMKAMYLPLWSSATANKWNLINPVDTNAAYRLTFSTGWTHSSSGITPTNAFASTYLSPLNNLQLNSTHLSYYSRTNSNGAEVEIGVQSNSGLDYTILELRTSNLSYSIINSTISGTVSGSDTDSRAFYVGNRTASNVVNLYRNSTKIINSSTVSTNRPQGFIYLGAFYSGSASAPSTYSTKQCSFSSIGDGLTDAESVNFYNRVNTLMTYFGINV